MGHDPYFVWVISHLRVNKPFPRGVMYVQLEITFMSNVCNCMSVYLDITYEGHVPSYSGLIEFKKT